MKCHLAKDGYVGEIVSHSALELQTYGAALGKTLVGGTVIVLAGPLGAGKTTLVQGIARGMGIITPVTSPTFALMQLYEALPLTLVHCDFYRLLNSADLDHLGLSDFFTASHVVVIEWGQAYLDWLPKDCAQIEIIPHGGERTLRVNAGGHATIEEWVKFCQS